MPANAVIQVSYIGYVPQELRLGGKNHLDVVLKEDSQALDEIVVVGYGVQKKINLTGSVSSVKSEELERQPIVTHEGCFGRFGSRSDSCEVVRTTRIE